MLHGWRSFVLALIPDMLRMEQFPKFEYPNKHAFLLLWRLQRVVTAPP
jgi:hypothetical protein